MADVTRAVLPWSGVIGGAAGWFVSQQAGSNMVFAHCENGQWWGVALIGLLGIALAVGGGVLSYRCWRTGEREASGHRFVGLLGLLIAALLAFPILMQTIAGLLVPGCLS
ncbi:MAG TPA: hypothetical protein VFT56_07240 [Sphingomonas sp.]|nr:hypothetical protein [Sphingomonas sp.]